ncbi:DUF2642 domain-containing protein [Cohnella mopanensis]|uniref:DUF2642 domain-containing protein n=1 Tax=Cohnella mopanensis TaxID=2911966 RepID=UPI001EF7585E|nr:DUF2642 domain-containing protein [Cohnella mopanensis]
MLFSSNPAVQPNQPAPQQQETQSKQHNYVLQANQLIGQQVRVNRGGPDSIEGVLIAIHGDYLVILSESTICYVNGAHVKSITEGSKSGGKSHGNGSGSRSKGGRSGHKSHISAPNFQGLLSRLRHKHVQINRGGPEKLEGFLAETSRDNILLIVDREFVRIPVFHIKNVSLSQKNQNSNNNNNNKNNNKSGSNRSGGKNRSGGDQGRNKDNARR